MGEKQKYNRGSHSFLLEKDENGVWHRISDGTNYGWSVVQTNNKDQICEYYVVYVIYSSKKLQKAPSKKGRKRENCELETLNTCIKC